MSLSGHIEMNGYDRNCSSVTEVPEAPVYSSEDVQRYLERIGYPHDVSSLKPDLETLTTLTRYQKLAILFGSLDFCYYGESKPDMNFNPKYIFNKLILERREDFCVEHAVLLHNVLSFIGYKCSFTYASVADHKKRKEGIIEYNGILHFMNLVTIDGYRFSADVGFRITGAPTVNPIDRQELGTPGHIVRPINFIKGRSAWVYESNTTGKYMPYYIFTDAPYSFNDLEIIQSYANKHVESVFDRDLILSQKTSMGSAVLFNATFTLQRKGQTYTCPIKTEAGRRYVYKKFFGIDAPNRKEHLPTNMQGFCSDPKPKSILGPLGYIDDVTALRNELPLEFVKLTNFINTPTRIQPRL